METPNYRKASIYFDDETVLEVTQRGGGGSGVGGETGLEAVNLITGESTNDALAEKDETIEEQAGTIEEQEATIETQAGTISDLEDEVAAKQAIIDAFPTIEALNVTANGTYNEEGKAYSPVNVAVPEGPKFVNITLQKGVNNTVRWAKCGVGIAACEIRFDNSSSGSYWQRLLDSYTQNTALKIYAEADIIASSTLADLIIAQSYSNNILTITLNTATLKSWYASHTINDTILITINAV